MSEIIEEQAEAKEISKEIGQLCKSLSGGKDDIFLIKKIGLKVREIQKSYLKIQNVQVKRGLEFVVEITLLPFLIQDFKENSFN